MAKRFTDTNKYKKPFIRGLQGAYKLLWDYLYHECDHAGIWIVDFDVAQLYLGDDMQVNKDSALMYFNEDEVRIVEFDSGKKWFIPSFVDFQYGELNETNRAHNSVITILRKYNLFNDKGLVRSLEGRKDKDMDKDMDKDKVIREEDYSIVLSKKVSDKVKQKNHKQVAMMFKLAFKNLITEGKNEQDASVEASKIVKDDIKRYENFMAWIDENASTVNDMKEPFSLHQYMEFKRKFPDAEQRKKMLLNMHNWSDLLKKRRNAYATILNQKVD